MVIENWFSEVMHESKTPWPNDEGPWSVPSVADVLCARWLGASAWAWPRCIVGFGAPAGDDWTGWNGPIDRRSEEHTSELQSRLHLVCRLLLEKKKKALRSTSTRWS